MPKSVATYCHTVLDPETELHESAPTDRPHFKLSIAILNAS
jgi:hypothetical protein